MTDEERAGPSLLWAVLGPPTIGLIFSGVFRSIQRAFDPGGNLEGRDLTMYARRDEMLFVLFALCLLVFVIAGGSKVHRGRGRFAFIAMSGAISLITFFGIVILTLAP